jgi:hypothetical protein
VSAEREVRRRVVERHPRRALGHRRNNSELAFDTDDIGEEHADAEAEEDRGPLVRSEIEILYAELVVFVEDVDAGGATDLDVGRG